MILRDLLRIDGFTLKQAKIVELFYFGVGYKEIAIKFGITTKSVKGHIQNVYWSFDIHSEAELRAYCHRRLFEYLPSLQQ